jgi:glycosyltransferase involved in cell wall biosynthesis
VTYNPVDINLFNISGKTNSTESRNIIYVGRLEKYKGCLRALLAFQKIIRKYKNWIFTVVGDGPELSDVQNLLREDRLMSNKVVLKGKLDKEKIPEEMKKASFFVYPSEHETFGIVIAEAMACGLPVIVGDGTAPKEYVDIDSGILVPPRDIDAIAHAMEYMIEHHSDYNCELIRQKVIKKFGYEEFGKRLNQIYREFV